MSNVDNVELNKQQVREWLPFYANQTLTPAQQTQVEAGLQRYPELQAELAWLQTMRHTVQTHPLDPLPAGDLGWSTLAKRIAAENERSTSAAHIEHITRTARPAQSESGWREKLRDWLQANFTPVLATACAVLVVQAVVIGVLLRQDETHDGTHYSAAGAPDLAVNPAAGVLLQVTIRPHVTELQLRQTLRRFNATIVQGPTALGVYTLQIAVENDSKHASGNQKRTATQEQQRLQHEAENVFESVTRVNTAAGE